MSPAHQPADVLDALDKLLVRPEDRSRGTQHTDYRIAEDDPSARLNRVILALGSGNWLAFSPDKMRGRPVEFRPDGKPRVGSKPSIMSPLLATGSDLNHHKACDAMVVRVEEGKCQLVLIELKTTGGNTRDHTKQFQSTRCFCQYVVELLKTFHGIDCGQLEFTYVVAQFDAEKRMTTGRTTTDRSAGSAPHRPRRVQVVNGE